MNTDSEMTTAEIQKLQALVKKAGLWTSNSSFETQEDAYMVAALFREIASRINLFSDRDEKDKARKFLELIEKE